MYLQRLHRVNLLLKTLSSKLIRCQCSHVSHAKRKRYPLDLIGFVRNLSFKFIRFVKYGKGRVEKNLRLLMLDKKILCIFLRNIGRLKENKMNLAGGEVDELIVMANNGLFCDKTTRGVQTFITQLLSE